MKRGKNKMGQPILIVPIQMPVSLTTFARCLADHCWKDNAGLNKKMRIGEGVRILKDQLLRSGVDGTDLTLWEGSSEGIPGYNENYTAAKEWVSEHFPYLAGTTTS